MKRRHPAISHKNSLSNYNNSNRYTYEQILTSIQPASSIQEQTIIGFIVALGSNHCAINNLMQTRKLLESVFTHTFWSSEYVNPDYTASLTNPKPDYTNQCGYIIVPTRLKTVDTQQTTLDKVIKDCQAIENKVKQQAQASSSKLEKSKSAQHVSANHVSENHINSFDINSKNSSVPVVVPIDIDILAVQTTEGMIALKRRYPFKSHEWIGIEELYKKGVFIDIDHS